MTVTSVKILHNGWSGSETAGAGITFNVIYQVQVDDRNDGPLVVLNAPQLPVVGDPYNVGNDVDPFAFVKSVSPSPVAEKVWNVTVTFGPLEPGESPDGPQGQEPTGLDSYGQPTDDPIDEYVRITVSSVNHTRPAMRGAYIGRNVFAKNDFDGAFVAEGFKPGRPAVQLRADGDANGYLTNGQAIVNSVFTPFDPPPEIDYTRLNVSIEMHLRNHPGDWIQFVNAVNMDAIFFRTAFGEDVAFAAPYCARVMTLAYNERIKNGKLFWNTRVEILIDNLYTWRPDILDRGYCETSNKDVSELATEKNNIVDGNGLPIAEPVLLDGKGSQLDTEQFDAVYLRYALYPEYNFGVWGIDRPQDLQNRMNN